MQIGNQVEVYYHDDGRRHAIRRRARVVAMTEHVLVVEYTCPRPWGSKESVDRTYKEAFRLLDAPKYCKVVG